LRRCSSTLLLLAAIGVADPAAALFGDVDEAFGIEGSFRSIGAVTINYDDPVIFPNGEKADAFLQAPLRIVVAGKPTEKWSYTTHAVQFVSATTYDSASSGGATLPSFGLSTGTARYRALDLKWEQVSDPQTALSLGLDRLSVARESDSSSLRIGRQAITLGHAFLWSPMDVFLPFDPRQFDQSYKPGVDAGRATWAFGSFSGVDAIGVLGRKTDLLGQPLDPDKQSAGVDWYGSAVLGRIYGNLHNFDLSLQGGKIYGAYQIAGGLAGEIRGIDLRGEISYKFAQDGSLPASLLPVAPPGSTDLIEDHLEATLAIAYYFSAGVTAQLQYFYNGAGSPDDPLVGLIRVAAQESFAVSRNLIGLSASWEATPLLNVGALMVISGDDGSLQLQPIVRYSISNESELVAGAAFSIGDQPVNGVPQSEYGTAPHSLFFEFIVYF
jgi:hypothetical protein